MKKIITFILAAAILFLLCLPCGAIDVSRVVDEGGLISPESLSRLNATADEYSTELDVDLAAVLTSGRDPAQGIADYLTGYYSEHDLGLGDLGESAVLLAIDPDNTVYGIYIFGEMEALLGSEGQSALCSFFEEDISVEGATYADVIGGFLDHAKERILARRAETEDAAKEIEEQLREAFDSQETAAQTAGEAPVEALPDWYPAGTDLSDEGRKGRVLTAQADLTKPHVVDNGNLLSDEQEAACQKIIEEFMGKRGVDLVLFTDSSTHGLDAEDYAYDFYTLNGYGKDGAIVCITGDSENPEPAVRGFGKCRDKVLTNEGSLVKALQESVQSGSYDGAMETFSGRLGRLLRSDLAAVLIAAVLLAVLVAVIVVLKKKAKKGIKKK